MKCSNKHLLSWSYRWQQSHIQCPCLHSLPSPTNLLVEPVVCQEVDELLPVVSSHTDVLTSFLQLHQLTVEGNITAYNLQQDKTVMECY